MRIVKTGLAVYVAVLSLVNATPVKERVYEFGHGFGTDVVFTGAGQWPLIDDTLRIQQGTHVYLKFDPGSMPRHAVSATLRLYCYQVPESHQPLFLGRPTYEPRTKPTTTARAAVPMRAIPSAVSAGWFSVDITELYNSWRSGVLPNYGIRLSTAGGDGVFLFRSSRYEMPEERPRLVLKVEESELGAGGRRLPEASPSVPPSAEQQAGVSTLGLLNTSLEAEPASSSLLTTSLEQPAAPAPPVPTAAAAEPRPSPRPPLTQSHAREGIPRALPTPAISVRPGASADRLYWVLAWVAVIVTLGCLFFMRTPVYRAWRAVERQLERPDGQAPPLPLEGALGKWIFALVLALCLAAGVFGSSLSIDVYRAAACLTALVTILGFGWHAFTISSNTREFFESFVISVPVGGTFIALGLTNRPEMLWPAIVIAFLMALAEAYDGLDRDGWIFEIAWIGWILVPGIVIIGSSEWFSFGEQPGRNGWVRYLFDARYAMTALFFATLVILSFAASMRPFPVVHSIHYLKREPSQKTRMGAFLYPFVVGVTLSVNLLIAATNILVLAIEVVGIYAGRTAAQVGKRLVQILTNRKVVSAVFKVMVTLVICLLFAHFAEILAVRAVLFLRSDTSFWNVSPENVWNLLSFCAFWFCTLLTVRALHWLWISSPNVGERDRALSVGAAVAVCFEAAGLIFLLLARIKPLAMTGFDSPGVFTVAMLIFSVLVALVSRRRRTRL
jgi:hypothetical protein